MLIHICSISSSNGKLPSNQTLGLWADRLILIIQRSHQLQALSWRTDVHQLIRTIEEDLQPSICLILWRQQVTSSGRRACSASNSRDPALTSIISVCSRAEKSCFWIISKLSGPDPAQYTDQMLCCCSIRTYSFGWSVRGLVCELRKLSLPHNTVGQGPTQVQLPFRC